MIAAVVRYIAVGRHDYRLIGSRVRWRGGPPTWKRPRALGAATWGDWTAWCDGCERVIGDVELIAMIIRLASSGHGGEV